ncbi:MAG: LysR family transcriptional regulator [Natronospirillum sp.]|uniref:LysR family transcriptional regulator n=1 Tax=Natronospirillum sp. TaxID=2812955 RepID=UPI0025D1EAF7|nr:LysR family transcriptional regulator [Natronospirillum sp.]MCH8552168.1 LysR family transcriptional regulator [Natronospirillum sp.]
MKTGSLPDTQLLQTFATIAESESLTDAARRLGVTQSAVSQTLKQLESEVGVELVVRRTRPLQLTSAGLTMKQQSDQVLADLRRLVARVRSAADMGVLQCRLGLISSCSEVLGSSLIEQLGHRSEQLNLKSGVTPVLIQSFLNREIDILISDSPLAEMQGLERFPLFRDPLLLAIPEPWLTVATDELTLPVLAQDYPMIGFTRTSQIGLHVDLAVRRMHLQTQVRFETDETHTLMSLVQDQHGWAIVSALCAVQTLYKTEGVRLLALDDSRHARTLYLVARQGELGDLPTLFAGAIRDMIDSHLVGRLGTVAPWVESELFAIDRTEP